MSNKNNFLNKHGEDPILSIYWFVIIIFIGLSVFAMASLFYSAPYDVRSVEAEILSNKLANCLSNEGKINPAFISGENVNVFDNCSLNFQTEKEFGWENTEQYFFKVEIYDLQAKEIYNFSGGNLNWEPDCFITNKKGEEYKNFPKCSEKRIYAINDSSNQFLIKILSVVAKNEKNIRQ